MLPKDFWPSDGQEWVTVEAILLASLSLVGTKRFCGRDRKVAICDFKFSSQLTCDILFLGMHRQIK